jgi:hypothetical protein
LFDPVAVSTSLSRASLSREAFLVASSTLYPFLRLRQEGGRAARHGPAQRGGRWWRASLCKDCRGRSRRHGRASSRRRHLSSRAPARSGVVRMVGRRPTVASISASGVLRTEPRARTASGLRRIFLPMLRRGTAGLGEEAGGGEHLHARSAEDRVEGAGAHPSTTAIFFPALRRRALLRPPASSAESSSAPPCVALESADWEEERSGD